IAKAKTAAAEAAERQQRQEAADLRQAKKEARERQEQDERNVATFAALPAEEQARLIACAERQHGHKLGETEWLDSILRLTAYRLMNKEGEEKAKAERIQKAREAREARCREQRKVEDQLRQALITDEELNAIIVEVYGLLGITPGTDLLPERQRLREVES